ncbi:MAG: acyl-CoA desaturase [bacterium]|nr:acyl-CoA desaturase [bacterium]
MTDRTYKTIMVGYVIIPLVAVVTAIVLLWNNVINSTDLFLLIVFQVLSVLGITVGFHRMLTHDGFKSSTPTRLFFTLCGCMALEGKPLAWIATHVKHHAHSDHEDDPHSPLEGFWHGHMGWVFSQENFEDPKVYCPHLLEDKVTMFAEKTYFFWPLLSFAICYAVGGWTGLLWGGLVRSFLTTHITWSVNSICHTFGSRGFETTDESRNNWLIGLLALGEGWHNNHHAFPRNAFHGMRWYQFDLSGIVIRNLERLGLAWDVQRIGKETQEAHKLKGLTMHQNIADLKAELGEFIDHARHELDLMILKLPPKKVAALRLAHEKTMKRYTDIQLSLARRRNMKRKAIEKRHEEVAKLLEIAKRRMKMVRV